MRALITGSAGFIGSHLADLLLLNEYQVVGIDNFNSGRLENFKHNLNNPNFSFLEIDIRNSKELNSLNLDFDIIFHLAGLADIVPSIEEPQSYFDVNVSGTLNLLEFAKKNNVKKFLYAASSSCYGIPDEYPTNENAELRPQYPYALTKIMGEDLVMHWSNCYKINCNSLRLFNVYGPRSRTTGAYGAVFGVFLAQKINNKPFTVVGNGEQSRDFTYVSDVAKAFLKVSQSDSFGQIYNIGSGNHYKINYLVSLLGGDIKYIPKRPGEPDCTFADTSKIFRKVGWVPEINFESGVKIMLDNISLWNNAPIWTEDSIKNATKTWFKFLGDNNE